jgi:hypothetical protein
MARYSIFIRLCYALFLATMATTHLSAQHKTNDLVQISGLVLTSDSLRALPLVSVKIKSSSRGTYTDPGGFFSIVAKRTDTLVFSFIGFKSAEYVLPQNSHASRFSIIKTMSDDTLMLDEIVIRSWPTPEEFNYYFVNAKIPDEYGMRARYNTRRQSLNEVASGMRMDGRENYRGYLGDQYHRNYYNGQLPPQRLFDPLAWQEFYNSWKRGDLKKK